MLSFFLLLCFYYYTTFLRQFLNKSKGIHHFGEKFWTVEELEMDGLFLIRSHLGSYAVVTVGLIRNLDEL
jgi:hypothetical protein